MDRNKSMRKITCLLLLLVTMHASAREFRFIPRAGLNLANTTNTGGSMKPGLNFGIATEYMFTPVFAAETGLYYSLQGARFKFASVDLKHDYLNIPILAKLYVYKGLNFFVGPQFGIKMSVNKLSYSDDNNGGKLIDSDMTKPFDAAAVIGAGYLFRTGLVISANANIGLTNKAKDSFVSGDEIIQVSNQSYKNMVIQFNFGYRF
jgi:hypothetical protein